MRRRALLPIALAPVAALAQDRIEARFDGPDLGDLVSADYRRFVFEGPVEIAAVVADAATFGRTVAGPELARQHLRVHFTAALRRVALGATGTALENHAALSARLAADLGPRLAELGLRLDQMEFRLVPATTP